MKDLDGSSPQVRLSGPVRHLRVVESTEGKHRRSIAVRYGLLMDGHDCMSKSVDGGRTQRVQP
jgi:hypothetical protein